MSRMYSPVGLLYCNTFRCWRPLGVGGGGSNWGAKMGYPRGGGGGRGG